LSGTVIDAADDEYIADRWYALTESGAIQVERGPGDTRRYAASLAQVQATAQRIGLAQIIEGVNCRYLRGQSVTLSFRVQCNTTQDIRYAVLEWTGTEDTVTSDVVATWGATPTWATNVAPAGSVGSTSVGSTWTDIEHTVTLGSTFNNLVVFIWSGDTLLQSRNISIEAAQLEQGAYKTPFETRPTGMELALCQRYFERLLIDDTTPFATGFADLTTRTRYPLIYPAPKRTTPTLSAVGSFEAVDDTGIFSITITFSGASARAAQIIGTGSGFTENNFYIIRGAADDSGIDMDCEL
jgi:hypothetical protein